MSTQKSLAKSAGIIGIATIISRILGFFRDILIARLFGTARYAQAFVVAFRIPNLLRDLVGEGAANAAFVPVFSEYITLRGKKEFWELANVVLNLLLVILMTVTVIGIIFAPLIVRIIAPGFMANPEKLQMTVTLTRIMFPYILLIGLTAYAIGVLNSLKHFAMPALGPCLLNITLIASALFLCPRMETPVMGLAIGVLVGGVAQLLVQIPLLFRKGMVLSKTIRFVHPAASRIKRLLIPRVLGTAVYQINIFVDTILASLTRVVGEGGVAALYYSNRLIQFPLAVFGIAIATAALPTMSTQAAENNLSKLRETLSFSLRSVFLIMIPSTMGLLMLGEPIIKVLFQRGQFDSYSTQITSWALLFYSFGLFAYAGIKILVSCFHSLQDTLTPVKAASFSLIVNVVLNLMLMWKLKVGGLALATSIAATMNFFILLLILKERIGGVDGRRIARSTIKIIAATIIMGAACWWTAFRIDYSTLVSGRWTELIGILIPICVSMLVFVGASCLLGVEELRMMERWVAGKSR